MGMDKATLILPPDGRTLIERAADKLSSVFEQLLVVTNAPETHAFLGLPMAGDRHFGRGPLAGIHAALESCEGQAAFILACDLPFWEPGLVRFMAVERLGYDVVVPHIGGEFEPMCALYDRRCLPFVENLLTSGDHRIIAFFPEVRVRRINEEEAARFGAPSRMFLNCNTPEDLERARALAAAGVDPTQAGALPG
jgi:molybdopterin-guanine dinucleotide biosynthesis protein A